RFDFCVDVFTQMPNAKIKMPNAKIEEPNAEFEKFSYSFENPVLLSYLRKKNNRELFRPS
ncbi:MAG: hypothetical protein LBF17_05645, partial [Mediterranea sp.]|nr:hypothetical protein [Mediterranea sp.]